MCHHAPAKPGKYRSDIPQVSKDPVYLNDYKHISKFSAPTIAFLAF